MDAEVLIQRLKAAADAARNRVSQYSKHRRHQLETYARDLAGERRARRDAPYLGPFFITGLPRTRTAWLANLFTTDRALCFHEPLEGARVVHDYAGEHLRVGVSSAALTLDWEAVHKEFPSARWIYVDRDEQESLQSLLKFVQPHIDLSEEQARAYLQTHQENARKLTTRADLAMRHVKFQDLDNPEMIESLWHWLLPEVGWNARRYQILRGLNVQQQIEPALEAAHKERKLI